MRLAVSPVLHAPAGTAPASAQGDTTMMQWLLTALCMAVINVAFVVGWAALVVGARYDEHNDPHIND